jgi:hypothetical protein
VISPVWRPCDNGDWLCIVCNVTQPKYKITRHEDTTKHQRNFESFRLGNPNPTATTHTADVSPFLSKIMTELGGRESIIHKNFMTINEEQTDIPSDRADSPSQDDHIDDGGSVVVWGDEGTPGLEPSPETRLMMEGATEMMRSWYSSSDSEAGSAGNDSDPRTAPATPEPGNAHILLPSHFANLLRCRICI